MTGQVFFFMHSFSDNTGTGSTVDWNFGQRPFAYAPPAGFLPLSSANLSMPQIRRGDDAFHAGTRTGTGAAVNFAALRFQPAIYWNKSRASRNHHLVDSARGNGRLVYTNLADAENNIGAGAIDLTSSGFDLSAGVGINVVGEQYADWLWRAGPHFGCDVVTYTGNGVAGRTVAHALNAPPHMMIVKPRGGTVAHGWRVWHRALAPTHYLQLNTPAAQAAYSDWNGTAPTASVFSVNGAPAQTTNENGTNYVAYLWTEISGFSRFGSYVGNGSSDGPFLWCGFRPRWVLVKAATVATSWYLVDAARGPFNVATAHLYPNVANAEDSNGAQGADLTATGFKVRAPGGFGWNNAGETYVFAAFAETPFKFATAR
jgi:hypothetical protein